jgi:hypothetical protein
MAILKKYKNGVSGLHSCPEGYIYDNVVGQCVLVSEQKNAEAEVDKAKGYYKNWYENRVIPGDEELNILYQKLKPKYLENLNNFPKPELKKIIEGNPNNVGSFEYLDSGKGSKLILKKGQTPDQLRGTTMHETASIFNLSNAANKFQPIYQNILKENIKPFKREWNDETKEAYNYISQPDEINSRIMRWREKYGHDPKGVVTPEQIEKEVEDAVEKGYLDPTNPNYDSDLKQLLEISKDKKSLSNMFNLFVKVDNKKETNNIS